MSNSTPGAGHYPQVYNENTQDREIESQKTRRSKNLFSYLPDLFAKRLNRLQSQNDNEPEENPFEFMPSELRLPGHGYRTLANLMVKRRELAIFRKFSALNMINLLNLQAELMDLQERFVGKCQIDDEAWHHDPNSMAWKFAYEFYTLRESHVRQYIQA
jgi:hypothetical protein